MPIWKVERRGNSWLWDPLPGLWLLIRERYYRCFCKVAGQKGSYLLSREIYGKGASSLPVKMCQGAQPTKHTFVIGATLTSIFHWMDFLFYFISFLNGLRGGGFLLQRVQSGQFRKTGVKREVCCCQREMPIFSMVWKRGKRLKKLRRKLMLHASGSKLRMALDQGLPNFAGFWTPGNQFV